MTLTESARPTRRLPQTSARRPRARQWWCAIVATLAACAGAGFLASSAAAVTPGWAGPGDIKPSNVFLQYKAEANLAASPSECGPNAILLYRVRGSGEPFGSDQLGKWTYGAGIALIGRGWRVRDLQARYAAPAVPLAAAVGKAAQGKLGEARGDIDSYRATAAREVPALHQDLVAAYNRCPQRTIAIAGYSLGNIVLRRLIRTLPVPVLRRIVAIDLVSDPSADPDVDRGLATDGLVPEARRGLTGVETWLGTNQAAYPLLMRSRAVQYCAVGDVICDASLGKVRNAVPTSKVWQRHSAYAFQAIGALTAARRIGNAPASAEGPVPNTDPGPGSATGGVTPATSEPRPTAANLIAVNYGDGHVGVAFDVGWQAGRDPVICRFYDNGVETFSAQCGTRSSKQFYGLAPGRHTFHATVTDRFGIVSDPTNSATVEVIAPTPSQPPPTGVSDRLSNDGRLAAASSEFLRSADGRYRFVMQADSNLVLYGPSGRPIWSTNTVGRGANHLRMQGDGNLVIYNGANTPIWATNTPRHYSAYLVVQNDGNVVIYDRSSPIWSTNTAGRT